MTMINGLSHRNLHFKLEFIGFNCRRNYSFNVRRCRLLENGFVELMLVENLPNRFTRNSIDYNKVDNDLLGTTEKLFTVHF